MNKQWKAIFFLGKIRELEWQIHYGCLHTMCTPISTFFCHKCFLPSYFVNVSTINLSSIHIENKMFKSKLWHWDLFQGDVFMRTIQQCMVFMEHLNLKFCDKIDK